MGDIQWNKRRAGTRARSYIKDCRTSGQLNIRTAAAAVDQLLPHTQPAVWARYTVQSSWLVDNCSRTDFLQQTVDHLK